MASFRGHQRGSGICLIMVVPALCMVAQAVEFAGGTGEPNDPYQIATAEQLIAIGSDPNLLNKHFALVADIDLDPNLPGGRIFDKPVIGTDTTGFSGSFDGRGWTIANLHIVGQRLMSVRSIGISADTRVLVKSYAGLFKRISTDGLVSNLSLCDVNVVGGDGVGALAVDNQGTILNCYATGMVSGASNVGGLTAVNRGSLAYCHAVVVVTGSYRVGGLIGDHESGSVTHSSAHSCITGAQNVGGLIGEAWGRVTHCWATADIITSESDAAVSKRPGPRALADNPGPGYSLGGLIGYCRMVPSSSQLRDCYATGSIIAGSSSSAVGGLTGEMGAPAANCYAATRIVVGEGSRWVGGLAGIASSTNWQRCYFLDPNDGGGPNNNIGTPLTDARMRHRESFTGWDFFGDSADGEDDPWYMAESSYPVLTSQTGVTGLVHLPSLRGVELRYASTLIESAGLTMGEVAEDYSKEVARGRVLDITPHGALPKGAIVQVMVSKGPYRWEEDNPGDGFPSNPYQIQTRDQFLELGQRPDLYGQCFVLMCDIDLGNTVFQQSPIARNVTGETYEFKGTAFSGRFDGAMHTISNLTIASATPTMTVSHMGLFGSLAATGRISRLRVENACINHSGTLGSSGLLCGESRGEIRDCHAGGEVSYGLYTQGVGGLVGTNHGFVTRSTAEATLFFIDPAAVKSQGLVAAGSGSISIMRGTAPGRNAPKELGVLIGTNYGIVTDCHARGSVAGSKYSYNMAGIVGANWWNAGTVASCYCVATVSSDKTVTGAAVNGSEVMSCYYLRDPALPDPASGPSIGLTDAQMRQQASFVGWDFETIWSICEGRDYPRLRWEQVECE